MKTALFIFTFSFLTAGVFSQARVNREMAFFLPKSSEVITEADGWHYNSSLGQWIGNKNVITRDTNFRPNPKSASESIENFISLQVRMFNFEGTEYYLLNVRHWWGDWKYPNSKQDWIFGDITSGYIFTAEEYNKLHALKRLRENRGMSFFIPRTAETAPKIIGWVIGSAELYKDDDAYWIEKIQSEMTDTVGRGQSYAKYVFPIAISEEGNIRFRLPAETDDYPGKVNLKESYFEITPEVFSKILIE